MNRALALLQKAVDVRPNEVRTLGLGFAFHFLILTGYYILRPIRDSIAASNRLETLPWMFTATLVAMLLANVLFAAVVARMPRRKFIPLAYGFFIFNLGLFFVLMRSSPPEEQVWIGRGLYVWVSVFNLFNTAIFWAFMTDLFTVPQGKRLYGFIAVGG
jgi:AAA family ATP:ADP antiporter